MEEKVKDVIAALHAIGAVKFGEFKLKSGIISPVYIDLRLIISYPKLLNDISELLYKKVSSLSFQCLCGVPYTAIPIATAISITHNVPMVLRRKEPKAHGTGKMIEGVFEKGAKVLVVDDIVTSGISIFETINPLVDVGLVVQDVVVLIDREQGGRENIEGKGYRLHSLFTLKELLNK